MLPRSIGQIAREFLEALEAAEASQLANATLPRVTLRQLERMAIDAAIKRVGSRRSALARELGIARGTLNSKLKSHGFQTNKKELSHEATR